MKTIVLGKSSLRASRLAYGGWRLASAQEGIHPTPESEARGLQAVLTAYEAGFTLFDLADVYGDGRCEEIVGQALAQAAGMRERVLIASKCGIRRKGDPDATAPYRYDFSKDHIVRSCEASLKRIGVESLDLFQLHRPDFLADPAEVAAAFDSLKKAGKAREFGVSNFRPAQVEALQRHFGGSLVVNQVEISLAHLDCLHDGTLDQCLATGMTPMAWSPLNGGRLVDTSPIDMHRPDHAQRQRVRDVLDHVSRERGVSRSAVALAWLLKHPAGIVPIIGTTSPAHIQDAATVATGLDLSREEWYRLMEAATGHRLA